MIDESGAETLAVDERDPKRGHRDAILLLGGTTFANVLSFGFHLVVGRSLSGSDYGGLVSLLAIVLVLSVPLNALQIAVAKSAISPSGTVVRGRLGPLLRGTTLAATFLWLLSIPVAPTLARFLKLPSSTSVVLVVLFLVPAAATIGPKGVLLAERRFAEITASIVAGALARVLFGLAFGLLGFGLNGAVFATTLAEIVMFLVATAAVWGHIARRTGPAIRLTWSGGTASIAAFAGYWVYTGMDVVLARNTLNKAMSGDYGAAATAGRSVLFLSAAVSVIVFPTFVEGRGNAASRRALWLAVAAAAAAGAVAATAIAFLPGIPIQVLYGNNYQGAVSIIGLTAFSAAGLGVVNILIHYHIAQRSIMALLPWAAVAIAGVAITLNPDPAPAGIAVTMVVVTAIAIVAMALPIALKRGDEALTLECQVYVPATSVLDTGTEAPLADLGSKMRPNVASLLGLVRERARGRLR